MRKVDMTPSPHRHSPTALTAAAEAEARHAQAQAEAQIAASRAEAAKHVTKAAQDAAADIVARLTGDTVTPEEAAAAVKAVGL